MDEQKHVINIETKSALAPTSIGKLKAPKARKTGLIMIFFFILLFGCLYYLPEVYSYFENIDLDLLTGGNTKTSKIVYTNNNDKFYELNTTKKIYIDSVGFYGFSISNNVLSYKIENHNENRIYVTELNLFISLYNESEALLGTFAITGNIVNPEFVIDNLTRIPNVDVTTIKYIKISKNEQVVIPEVVLNEEGGYGVLTCSLKPDAYTYYFVNRKLEKVYHEINVNKDESDDFEMEKESYTNKKQVYLDAVGYANDINLLIGIDNIKFSTNINLQSENIYDLDEYYMALNADANNVSFDMKTKGFDCK